MKKIISFAFFLVSFFEGGAQIFKYEILDKENYTFSDNIISIQNGFLLFEVDASKKVMLFPGNVNKIKYGLTVSLLDADLNKISSKELFNGEKKIIPWLYEIFKLGENTCILYQDIDEDGKLSNLKMVTINEKTLEIKDEMTVFDYKKMGIEPDSKKVIKNESRTYNVYLSQSANRLMLTAEQEYEKEENKALYIKIIDENLRILSERKVDFGLANQKVNIISALCDDNGNAYFAYREFFDVDRKGNYLDESGNKNKKGNVSIDKKKLLIVKKSEEKNIVISYEIDSISQVNTMLAFSPQQNKVFVLGAYSDGWDEKFIGIYYTAVDVKTMQMAPVTVTPFSKDLVERFDEDGYANTKEKKYGLSRYFVPTVFLRGDGTVDYILFYSEAKERTSYDSRGIPRNITTTFYGGNFLDVHLVNDKLVFTRLPRDMGSANTDIYNQFSLFSKDENLVFLYNDDEDNIDRSLEKSPVRGVVQKSEVCAATVDNKGILKRELLLKDYKSKKTIALLGRLYRANKKTFFILIQKLNFMSMSTKDIKFAKVMVE